MTERVHTTTKKGRPGSPGGRFAYGLGILDGPAKVFAFAAYLSSAGLDDVARLHAERCFYVLAPLGVVLYLAFVRIAARPIDRWWCSDRIATSTHDLLRVARRIDSMPTLAAVGSAFEWALTFEILNLLCDQSCWTPHALFFLGAVVVSVPFMTFMVARVLANRPHAAVAKQALDARTSLAARERSVSGQLAYFCFALCGAPTFFITSLLFGVKAHPASITHLGTLVACFLAPIPVYWIVSAMFMAKAVTRPVGRLANAIQLIATGDVESVRQIAVLQNDELGKLTTVANGMIGRLAQSEGDRRQALVDLEALNRTLEARVEERTISLAKAELELRQAQKLESVGRLAAGVAHEINTPVQFVGDSLVFIEEAVNDMLDIIAKQDAALAAPHKPGLLEVVDDAKDEADLPYLVEHVPKAMARARDGLARVAGIVRAMKEFAYPEQREMTSTDLNHAIESTLTVAKNEYKYVADLVVDLAQLPQVMCHIGELNQVVLNLVVNASHAIEDQMKKGKPRGIITVGTRLEGDHVVISVGDTGGGIPAAIQGSIFDPFFTTKGVGRGTGQGLAIARSVVVDKHGGQLTFESTPGLGTTFHVRLPVGGRAAIAQAA